MHKTLKAFSILLALALAIAVPAFADPPAGYYDTVDANNSTTLRNTLHPVIDDHTRHPYTASTTDTWDIINLADEDPDNSGNIIDLYKNASYAKIPGGVGAYNREHSWPKSYGFPSDGSTNYPYTDCHHLIAADSSYNSARSNRPFRICDSGCTEYTTDVNNGRGGGSGVYPGNSNWGTGSFTQGTWQTWDGRKGDVARALFYMDIRYEGGTHSVTGINEPDLRLTDNEALIDSSNTGANESVAYMGMLSVLLQWHQEDPPDAREMYRNDTVASFQGNRNPFVDHPEWVDCLYNNVCSFDTDPPAAPQSLMATALNGGADLSWLANGEPDLNGYNVYRSTSAGGPYAKVNSGLVGTNAYIDGGLTNGTTYYYVVTAVDTSNNESADSNVASVTPDGGLPDSTPPGVPTGFGATGNDGSVTLSWNANGEGDLAGYNLYRATSSGGPYSLINTGGLITGTGTADNGVTNGTTYFYVLTAVDTSSNESGTSAEANATPSAPGGTGDLILTEVFYDPSSTDDGLEWVELYNRGATVIDLSLYSLGNGGTDYTYSVVQLSGTVQPGQTFVVGGPTSNASNYNPTFNQVFNFSPDFQNSGTTGDGVALFDVPAASVNASTVPIDAVVYGPNNNSGLIDESGSANAPEVGDAPSAASIERLDSQAGGWQIQSSPTPNSVPFSSGCTVDAECDDGLFCNGAEVCNAGTCEAGTAPSCDDGVSCTADSCNEGTDSCDNTPNDNLCDNGLWCDGAETCHPTLDCQAGTAPSCGFGCDESGDTCYECGVDADCDDSLFCNGAEACSGGYCLAGSDPCPGQTCNESGDVCESGGGSCLVISEVLYDTSGNDDGKEWVEIYNTCATAVNLAGYSLGSGGNTYTNSTVDLAGVVQPGAVFVVGGPTSNGSNGNASFDQVFDFSPDLQNSGSAGDGVALFNVPASQISGAVPIDAVVYGPNNNNGLIDETGLANAPEVGDASSGSSIERIDAAGNWQIQSSPTPNSPAF